VRREQVDVVTTRFTTLTRCGGVVVVLTLIADISSIFSALAASGVFYISAISLAGLCLLVFTLYGSTITYLLFWGGSSGGSSSGSSSTTRSSRNMRNLSNRLSFLCAFLLIRITSTFTWYCFQLTGDKFVPLDIVAGTTVAYEGLVDSLVMGNLCMVEGGCGRLVPISVWRRLPIFGRKSSAYAVNTARLRQVGSGGAFGEGGRRMRREGTNLSFRSFQIKIIGV